ncbi:unnamed protein product [Heligmosomoides polygyrus]|uniref:Integrase catalytic domain-containing protein n=1 Tax=Heligmosomoides polygyrus TaxID=6339 RepID=A0A183GU86_HELPZ|nr:unnamed protein product [Heligmosomoides polygyrus]
MATDLLEEAQHLCQRTTQMFADLNMNLREFSTNNIHLVNILKTRVPILILRWDTQGDTIRIGCQLPDTPLVTKRTVTSAIASIYDPLGWILPLLHWPKIFLNICGGIDTIGTPYLYEIRSKNSGSTRFRERDSMLSRSKTTLSLSSYLRGRQFDLDGCVRVSMSRCSCITAHGQVKITIASGGAICNTQVGAQCNPFSNEIIQFGIQPSASLYPHTRDTYSPTLKSYWERETGQFVHNRLNEIHNISAYLAQKSCSVKFGYVPSQENPADCGTRELTREDTHGCRESAIHQATYVTNQIRRSLRQLNIQLDEHGILRCYGRLNRVHGNNHRDFHKREHLGIDHAATLIKQEYWIPQIRSQVASMIRRCVPCQRFNTLPFKYPAKENLPKERVIRSYLFEHIGLDYFGPMFISPLSGTQETTRLIQLDVVPYLKTKAFLHMHRKFFARRGVTRTITCDNAPTFDKIKSSAIPITSVWTRNRGCRESAIHQATYVTNQIRRSLRQLNIQLDEHGILRCYGRLNRVQFDNNAKNPILILQKNAVSGNNHRDFHEREHLGIDHAATLIKQEYWIPQIRSQVASMIRRCVPCQRFNTLPFKYPAQENLPKERVIRSYPFEHIGLDYFGPMFISPLSGTQEKCYGAVLTCMATRLIQLDVVLI